MDYRKAKCRHHEDWANRKRYVEAKQHEYEKRRFKCLKMFANIEIFLICWIIFQKLTKHT